jgi:aminoglycoside phosphotransferase (APT) family kinase protein
VRSIVDAIVERVSPGQSVVALRKEASPFSTTARLWDLQVAVSDGTTLSIIHKESGRRARLPGAPRTIPEFVYDPKREIGVYEHVLAQRQLDTPSLYASLVEASRGRYWMFLERVPGMQLRWTVRPGSWHRAAAWLARAHAALQPSADANTNGLLIHDARFYRRWLRRAQVFTETTNRNRRTRLAWLARHHDRVIEVLVGLPRTVVHGEFYPSNILVDESTLDGRISVIDWEMAAVGPAVIDLAALTGGAMTSSDRGAILASYQRTRPSDSTGGPEPFGLEALACGRLQFAVQWMGWSRDWSPPEEQRHDWLAEAVELGETMGW